MRNSAGERRSVPQHVAVIMDGNGRWAHKNGLRRAIGHARGARTLFKSANTMFRSGVRYLTFYAFSSENWTRPADEVSFLMGLFQSQKARGIRMCNEQNVRLQVIGSREGLMPQVLDAIQEMEAETRTNLDHRLVLAFNYGSRAEIVEASRRLSADVAAGRVRSQDIDEELFSSYLHTAEIPDPDLIIRTSGVQRISNFLLWQSAYSELVFLTDMWPDFDSEAWEAVLDEFSRRERRFGGLPGTVASAVPSAV